MITLKRILLPTDFSPYSHVAVRHACALAENFDAEIHLLHVLQDLVVLTPEPGMAVPPTDLYLKEMQTFAEEALTKVLDPAWAEGRAVTRVIRQGAPFVEILQYAREQDVDLIVLATHGRSALAHLLLGSVTEKVVRKARCPVLTVRPAEHEFVMP